MEAVVVTPSRLHFGLIDLNGKLGRIDGGFGLALAEPRFVLRARPADRVEISGAGPFAERARRVVDRLVQTWDLPGVRVEVVERIPPHHGFGSGTQLTLGLLHVVAAAYRRALDRDEAIRLSERGGTSGIGIYAFYHGGFLVDGGHRFPEQKDSYLPSAASPTAGVGPLLIRREFPDWPILLVVPQARHISGEEERRLFQTLCPQPESAAAEICYRLVMDLLPALAEEDLPRFARALEALQQVGWKRVELDVQAPPVRETIAFLHEQGVFGVAMSSWGPALAVFTENPVALAESVERFWSGRGFQGWCRVVDANNNGALLPQRE